MAFENTNITKKDLALYKRLASKGQYNKLTSMFLNRYILPNSEKYQDMIKQLMGRTQSRVLDKADMSDISITISSATVGFRAAIKRMFKQVVNVAYAPGVFESLGITSPAVKNTIKGNTLDLFITKIEGALTGTNSTVLSAIRNQQTGLMKINAQIDRAVNAGEVLQKNVTGFKNGLIDNLKKTNPDFTKIIDNDKFVVYRDGSMHKLDDYAEMSVRTTLMNVERTAVEVKEVVRGHRVVEYYMRDHRAAKTPRKICPKILTNKFFGKSILALDSAAASVLGIMTVDQAKSTPDYAMGVFCRHSIRAVSASYHNRIDQILFFAEAEAS